MKLFDAHFHIIDTLYPLVENNGYFPPAFTLGDYQARTNHLDIQGGCIVSGSFQAFDQLYLMDVLAHLGRNFFGVANIPFEMEDERLQELHLSGVRGVRFNLKRGGSASVNQMVALSNKVHEELGWHTELYVDSQDLKDLKSKLEKLPPFSIDHLGLSKKGLVNLYHWVEKGTKIKATGFGRVDFEVLPVMRKIMEINPYSLMFGTDLPSTRAKKPFSAHDIKMIEDHFSKEDLQLIFWQNAHEWYAD